MSAEKSVHPLRRKKHRRGRRKKKPVAEPLALAPVPPEIVQNLRSRLALMSKTRGT